MQSNLIEFSYQGLYRALSGQEPIDPDTMRKSLTVRIPYLKKCYDPFPKPSATSKAALGKDTVKLADGVFVKIEPYQKDVSIKLSEKLGLDEVEAFTFLRSFLYNEQYVYTPSLNGEGSSSGSDHEAALVDAVTDFYFDERLFVLRTFISLYRSHTSEDDPYYQLTSDVLRETAPDPATFVTAIIAEYVRRSNQEVPSTIPHTNSSLALRSTLAKHIVREELCMIELVFWATYNLRCPGTLVATIYEGFYSNSLGAQQKNENLLIDPEASQLLADLQSIVVITAVQVLSVELLYEKGIDLEVVSLPRNGYFAQPEELFKIHQLIYSTPTQPRFSPIVLAWACVIRRLALAADESEYPVEYAPLMELLVPDKGARDSVWQEFTGVVLNPAMDLFGTLRTLLLSPLLDTQAAARLGSSITNPNDNVVRAILKGLVIGLTELIRVEYVEDFDGLMEVWIILFGSGEWAAVAPLCAEFWQLDSKLESSSRRALLEIARDRFPVQSRPLIRILRSLTATGDFRGLEGLDSAYDYKKNGLDFNRGGSAFAVYEYFDTLSTLTQVIPFEKDRIASLLDVRNTSAGTVYTSLKPMRLPGGSIIPPKTVGTLISDSENGSPLVIVWRFRHSGWRLALGLLKEYVKRRQASTGAPSMRWGMSSAGGTFRGSPGLGGAPPKMIDLSVEDIGIEEGLDDAAVVTDLLELFRAVLLNNPSVAPGLMQKMMPDLDALEENADLSSWERASLVEVIPVILQDALQFSSRGPGGVISESASSTHLITNAIGVLTTLLPHHPGGLWSSLRTSSLLIPSSKQKGGATTPKLVAVERVTGLYPMTLALLDLMQALVDESIRKMYNVSAAFRTLKTEVLLRGLALIHNEIWIDYENWKYVHLSEKYKIGFKITSLFATILLQGPEISLEVETPSSSSSDEPLTSLNTITRFVVDAFFSKAAPSTITPLISIISSMQDTRQSLHKARRFDDAHHLDRHLESCLRLCRLVLVRKAMTTATRACLLEQGLFVGVAGRSAGGRVRSQVAPLENIARFFVRSPYDLAIQLEGTKLLTTLCVSISSCHPSPPSIVGHLSNPEEVVEYFLTLVRHLEDESQGRLAAWAFLNTIMDTQPALAALLLSGKSPISSIIDTNVVSTPKGGDNPLRATALDAIDDTIRSWRTSWVEDPSLLVPALSLLDSIWQHAREHPAAIESLRKNERLWKDVIDLVKEPISPSPSADVQETNSTSKDTTRSAQHGGVSIHSYQALAKAHALHILSLDLGLSEGGPSRAKSTSAPLVVKLFESKDVSIPLFQEALQNPTSPDLHLRAKYHLESSFPRLQLDALKTVRLLFERSFGDDYVFPSSFVSNRLHQYADDDREVQDEAAIVFKEVLSLNLDWSMTDAHVSLLRAWSQLLDVMGPLVKDSKAAQQNILEGASLANVVADERRGGPIMTAVHADRLRFLHALVNAVWPYEATFDQLLAILVPLKLLVTHEVHNPLDSVVGLVAPPFHRTILELIYFCASKAVALDPSKLPAPKRVILSSSIASSLLFAIDSLRVVFERAGERQSEELDSDIGLMVSVFDICIKPELGVSITLWLARLQTTNLVRASLDLFSRSDVGGVQHPAILRTRPYPLYSQTILQFHRALASLPSSAERLAHEGVMGSYVMNSLTAALETASVDVMHVGHHAWCSIVAVIARIIEVLGPSGGHFVDAEVVGFVQLYGAQLLRTITWRLGDDLTLSLIQEMEAVVSLFHAIAITTSSQSNFATSEILRAYAEKALFLVQQLNAAVSYPNQLAGHILAITPVEGAVLQPEVELGPIQSSIEYLDKGDRPLLASVVQSLLEITSTVLTTLVLANGGDMLLMRSDNALTPDLPLISPSSKVSPEEPATMGTLQELGNWGVQLVVHLLKAKAPPAANGTPTSAAPQILVPVSLLSITPFDRRKSIKAARQVIESLMVYVATQLARWIEKDRQEISLEIGKLNLGRGERDGGAGTGGQGHSRRTSTGRPSMPLMHNSSMSAVQDQARELSILASRAKDVLAKLADDDGESSVLLLDILIGFTSAKLLKN